MAERDIHSNCKAQKKYAWARYYQAIQQRATDAVIIFRTAGIPSSAEPIPTECPAHLAREFWEMATELRRELNCPICMEATTGATITITTCGHYYCKTCLERVKSMPDPKCSTCRRKLG